MKNFLLICLFGCFMAGASAGSVTIIPYGIDPVTDKMCILLGQDFCQKDVPSPRRKASLATVAHKGLWLFPQVNYMFSTKDRLDIAAEIFNQKTVYCFARVLLGEGYSCLVPDADEIASGRDEGVLDCNDGGAYSDVESKKADFDGVVKDELRKQRDATPVLCLDDHQYYFFQVPFIPVRFIMAKRAFLKEKFPGFESISFGNFTPKSKLVGDLGADLEAFAWVDGRALVKTLLEAAQEKAYKSCIVEDPIGGSFKLKPEIVKQLSEDSSVIKAINRVALRGR